MDIGRRPIERMSGDDTSWMRHMLGLAREVVAMIQVRSRPELHADRMFQLALLQLIAGIGNSARRVTTAGQARAVDIPWSKLVATSNHIVREYDAVNLDAIWGVATREIPVVTTALERALHGC